MKMNKSQMRGCLKENALTMATLAGVILGVVLGIIIKSQVDDNNVDDDGTMAMTKANETLAQWTPRKAMYVAYVGKLFLSMLKAIIIPLIIPSLIASVGSLDMNLSGKVGGRAVAYYMITTFMAVFLGIVLVTTIQPGAGSESISKKASPEETRNVTTADTLMDLIRNCFPPNIVQSTVQQYRTSLIYPGEGIRVVDFNGRNLTIDEADKDTWKFKGEFVDNTNILGLVVFSIVTGVAIASSGEAGKPLLAFFESTAHVMMKLTTWIIYLAPVGVCFLVAGQITEMNDIGETFGRLGYYFGTVLLGLFIHGLIVLPLIYMLITRTLPFRFMGNMMNAYTTAFGTGSSSATLPVTLDCLERKNKIDERVSKFVLPIGATINMDGTALYEAMAAIFIAQVHAVPMSLGKVIAVSITATAASIGAAGIPQAGLVTMVMVLDTVGLPADSIAVILAVDWLLDRFRTAINVVGDSLGAGIVYHLSKNELDDLPLIDDEGSRSASAIDMKVELKTNADYNKSLDSAIAENGKKTAEAVTDTNL